MTIFGKTAGYTHAKDWENRPVVMGPHRHALSRLASTGLGKPACRPVKGWGPQARLFGDGDDARHSTGTWCADHLQHHIPARGCVQHRCCGSRSGSRCGRIMLVGMPPKAMCLRCSGLQAAYAKAHGC